MQKRTKDLGDAGEDFAVTYLQSQGYNIINRNFRYSRFAEVDIIAEIDGTIIFVEVKTRHSNKYGRPSEAVSINKQRKIIEAAMKFLQDNNYFDNSCRFDVIEVFANKNKDFNGWSLNHIKDAFMVS